MHEREYTPRGAHHHKRLPIRHSRLQPGIVKALVWAIALYAAKITAAICYDYGEGGGFVFNLRWVGFSLQSYMGPGHLLGDVAPACSLCDRPPSVFLKEREITSNL